MPAVLPALISAGVGAYQAAHNASMQRKAQQEAAKAIANRPVVQTSPAIAAYLADTQSRLNAVDPAVTAGFQQEQQAAADRMAQAERVASSGAQVLAVGGQTQGLLNQSAPALIAAQSRYHNDRLQDYYKGLGLMSEQDQLKAQDAHGAYADNLNFQLGLAGGAGQNIGQGVGLLATSLAAAANNGTANGPRMRVNHTGGMLSGAGSIYGAP